MKINSDIALNESVKGTLEHGVKTLCRFHRNYHHANSCEELVNLAFNIGFNCGGNSLSLLLMHADEKTRKRYLDLYYHLKTMCERKALKMCNQ